MSDLERKDYWEGLMNGVDPGEEGFSNIFDILNFPIESLGGDGLVGDWDASEIQNTEPIPLDALTEFPPAPQSNVASGSAKRAPSRNAPIYTKSDQKEEANCLAGDNGTKSPLQNLISPETSAFQLPSPVSVLESSSSCSSGKSLIIRPEFSVPVRARSKRVRPSSVNPWCPLFPITLPAPVARKSLNSGKNRERKRRLSRTSTCRQAMKKLPGALNTMEMHQTMQRSVSIKKCTHCEVTKTPQWREGPMGPKTLCNACGVRFRSGRLFPEYRPAASPTFIPSLHSNSHRKVVEMRKKTTQETDFVSKDPQMSPLPEFVPVSNDILLEYLF